MRRFACGFVLVLATSARAADPPPTVLCDFETGEPTDGWTIKNLIVAEIETPHGRGLKLVAKDETTQQPFVGFVHRASPVADWRTFAAFAMRVRVDAKAPVEMRLQALTAGGAGRKLRRFVVEPGDWRDVVLPLRDFRDETADRCGSFAAVERVLLRWDKGAGAVSIDDLRLLPGGRGALSCTKTAEDWRRLGFADAKSRVVESDRFVLLDDAPALADADAKRLLARLEEGLKVLADRYGVTGELGDKVPFFVFATRSEYEAFPPRLGEHFGATVSPPKVDGLSIFGAGMSSFDPAQGWDRPVFLHEALHGAIERLLGVSSDGNWIQEGLATAVQAQFHSWTFDRMRLAESFVKRSGWIVPWSELFAKPRVAMTSYPQIASIMDFLAEKRRDSLPKVWNAVRALKEPLHTCAPEAIATALGTDVKSLEEEWLAWGEHEYARKTGK